MKVCLYICLLCLPVVSGAQNYADSIQQFRKQYIKELLAEKRHPITASQVKNLGFFKPDRSYSVWASFAETPGSVPFLIPTHSGKQKPFREYGVLTFYIRDTMYKLHAYQSVDL